MHAFNPHKTFVDYGDRPHLKIDLIIYNHNGLFHDLSFL